MASLVVLEHHLWLTLTEIKDVKKVPFLDALVSPNGLFGPAVEGFAECFTELLYCTVIPSHATLPTKALQLCSCPKSALTQQPTKPAPAAAATTQPAKPEF